MLSQPSILTPFCPHPLNKDMLNVACCPAMMLKIETTQKTYGAISYAGRHMDAAGVNQWEQPIFRYRDYAQGWNSSCTDPDPDGENGSGSRDYRTHWDSVVSAGASTIANSYSCQGKCNACGTSSPGTSTTTETIPQGPSGFRTDFHMQDAYGSQSGFESMAYSGAVSSALNRQYCIETGKLTSSHGVAFVEVNATSGGASMSCSDYRDGHSFYLTECDYKISVIFTTALHLSKELTLDVSFDSVTVTHHAASPYQQSHAYSITGKLPARKYYAGEVYQVQMATLQAAYGKSTSLQSPKPTVAFA